MNEAFENLAHIIRSRRTIKPLKYNGRQIPDDQVQRLLELADWAPTHGHTEPWRFRVYTGDKVQEFCRQHAELYRMHTPEENYQQHSYDKLYHMGDQASHLVIAIMQRGNMPKIPAVEELAATACAVQNMLLGATALGIASYWGSGGMTRHEAMKAFLGLREEDAVLGMVYMGYADTMPEQGRRTTPLAEKVTWV